MTGSTVTRTVLAIVRTIVFLAGMALGFLSAAVVSSFGGSAAVDFSGVFFGIGLLVAAPICWIAAVRTKSGDRWTLAYVGVWVIYLVVVVLIDCL